MWVVDAELGDLRHLLLLFLKNVVVDVHHLAAVKVVDSNLLLLHDEHPEQVPIDAGEDRLVLVFILVVSIQFVGPTGRAIVRNVVLDDLAAKDAEVTV